MGYNEWLKSVPPPNELEELLARAQKEYEEAKIRLDFVMHVLGLSNAMHAAQAPALEQKAPTQEPKREAEEQKTPPCFGKKDYYDPDDPDTCKVCKFSEPCRITVIGYLYNCGDRVA